MLYMVQCAESTLHCKVYNLYWTPSDTLNCSRHIEPPPFWDWIHPLRGAWLAHEQNSQTSREEQGTKLIKKVKFYVLCAYCWSSLLWNPLPKWGGGWRCTIHTVDTRRCVTRYVHGAGEDRLLGQGGGGQEGVHLQRYLCTCGGISAPFGIQTLQWISILS